MTETFLIIEDICYILICAIHSRKFVDPDRANRKSVPRFWQVIAIPRYAFFSIKAPVPSTLIRRLRSPAWSFAYFVSLSLVQRASNVPSFRKTARDPSCSRFSALFYIPASEKPNWSTLPYEIINDGLTRWFISVDVYANSSFY